MVAQCGIGDQGQVRVESKRKDGPGDASSQPLGDIRRGEADIGRSEQRADPDRIDPGVAGNDGQDEACLFSFRSL